MFEKEILVLFGKRGAGKSTIAKKIVHELGFIHIEMSEFLNSLKLKSKSEKMVLRKFVITNHKEKGKEYFIKQVFSEHIEYSIRSVVITGVRHPAELNFLESHQSNIRLIFIYLNVNFLKRLVRIIKRESRNSLIQFMIEEYYSLKWGDKKLKNNSIKFVNNGNVENVFNEIQKIITSLE